MQAVEDTAKNILHQEQQRYSHQIEALKLLVLQSQQQLLAHQQRENPFPGPPIPNGHSLMKGHGILNGHSGHIPKMGPQPFQASHGGMHHGQERQSRMGRQRSQPFPGESHQNMQDSISPFQGNAERSFERGMCPPLNSHLRKSCNLPIYKQCVCSLSRKVMAKEKILINCFI